MAANGRILVFGASGTTGRSLVDQAVAAGLRVRAIERSWDEAPPAPPQVERLTADILEDDLAPLLDGVDAAISTLGLGLGFGTMIDPPPLYTESTRRLIPALRAASCRRLLVISALFADEDAAAPAWFRLTTGQALKQVFRQMADMERMLHTAPDIEWTAVRPGWLLDRPLTADYVVADGTLPDDIFRTRHADLAHFMLAEALEGRWIRATPAIGRREADGDESPLALAEDLKRLAGG